MLKSILKSFLPQPARTKLKQLSWLYVQKLMEVSGYTVSLKSDFYSPLPSRKELKLREHRWNRPSLMRGVYFDLQKMKGLFADLLSKYYQEFSLLPPFSELITKGYGPGYTAVDGLTLYMMIRHFRPKRYIEIGSGLSTYYTTLAAERNAQEGHPLEITCIDPYPYVKLKATSGVRIIQKEVQDIDICFFQQLEQDDVLFIDSSHIVKVDGDVPYLLLEVLPSLTVNVNIHVHDVPFPYNVPFPASEWIFNQPWPMLWNEAMMLQAFLCYNTEFSVELCTPLIRYYDESFLKDLVPTYESVHENPRTFSSIWIKRVSGLAA